MRVISVAMLVSAAAPAFAGQSMTVAICNLNQVPSTIIEHAKVETTYVFRSMDVEIHWKDCDGNLFTEDGRVLADFIVRVHPGGHVPKVGPVSLETMGRAYMDSSGKGYMVDAYYGAIHEMTVQFPSVGNDQLLGYTMAHELGHLLIGPGHRANGIMRAAWGRKEIQALHQRRLKFQQAERAVIMRTLQIRDRKGARAAETNPE